MPLRLEAFAKVNRSLVVLGRRPDGYHEVDTVLETIDLTDELTVEEGEGLSLDCDDPALPAGDDNLVARAARLLAREAGVGADARIRLRKRIPAGGGLGGGSSDAAATLRALAALWGVGAGASDLARLAGRLGSDVPFFLVGGRGRGTGRGERIEPLPDPAGSEWILLLFPPFGMPTPDVYRALGAPELTPGGGEPNLPGPGTGVFPDRNDLERAAERLRPELAGLRERLREAGAATARLSGSGSTVYGVFPAADVAETARRRLAQSLPAGTRTMVAPTIGRSEFERRAAPRPVP